MLIDFDSAKNAANIAKHGLPLSFAVYFDWGLANLHDDCRRDYGEPRINAVIPYGLRIYFVAFVDRPGVRRIISLRRANRREVKKYAAENPPPNLLPAD
jgi:uncharacterized protein